MITITPRQFRDVFMSSVSQLSEGLLRPIWEGNADPFTSLMKYTVLVNAARALGLSSAQEYRRLDSVFYDDAVENFAVAIEHENDNRGIESSEIPKLSRCEDALKVLITYTRGGEPPGLLDRIARAVRARNSNTATWLIIVGDPSNTEKLAWLFYVFSDQGNLMRLDG